MQAIHATSFRAVELEYMGSDCGVRTAKANEYINFQSILGNDFSLTSRSDHYFFEQVK